MITAHHFQVLQKIYARLKDHPINWVITGSLGFALQGVEVQANDIDLQTDQEGAYQIEALLIEYVTRPVIFSAAERIRSHFGALVIDGMPVEIMGDIEKRGPDGRWDGPVDLQKHRRFVELAGMHLPVLSLAYEYQAYLKMGRVKKANQLKQWLDGSKQEAGSK